MKNLYKSLNINPNASVAEIQRAVKTAVGSSSSIDAEYVLLNNDRRRVFDRCNDTLINIGKLRSNLGLERGGNWVSQNFTGYTFKATRNGSIIDEIINQPRNRRVDFNQTGARDEASKTSESKSGIEVRGEPALSPGGQAFLFLITILVIGIIVIGYMEEDNLSNSNSYTGQSSSPSISGSEQNNLPGVIAEQPDENVFNKQPSPLPVNGYVRNYTSREALAPLEIHVPRFSNHYFVKLENYYSGSIDFIIFIRGGQFVEVEVPLGTYIIKYATGKDWYGVVDLFGPGDMTRKYKAEDIFVFKEEYYQYTGYTIELIEQVGGNLRTSQLSDSDW